MWSHSSESWICEDFQHPVKEMGLSPPQLFQEHHYNAGRLDTSVFTSEFQMREICLISSYIFSLISIVFLQTAPILCYNYSPLSVLLSARTLRNGIFPTGRGVQDDTSALLQVLTHFVTAPHFGFLLFQSPSVDFTASSLFHFLCYSVARPHTSPEQTSSAQFTVSYKIGLWTDYHCSSAKCVNRGHNHRVTSTHQDPSFKTIRNVPLFL